MKKAVIIGAGQTGRGFIAPILEDNQYHLVFLDKDRELIEQLKLEKEYRVSYFGGKKKSRIITDFDAFWMEDDMAEKEIAEADVIFVSVCASHVREVVPCVDRALRQRKKGKVTIFCCENGVNVKGPFIEAGTDAVVSEGVIFCTTVKPDQDRLDLISQDYPELPVDGKAEGLSLKLQGVPWEMDFASLLQRKIYTYNFMSAVVAYLGSYKGYTGYGDAANDGEIAEVIERLTPVISAVIAKKYRIDIQEQLDFTNRAVEKFKNKEIKDTIERNARQAKRKLGTKERLLTPLFLAGQYKEDTRYIGLVVAAALYYLSLEEPGAMEEAWENIRKQADAKPVAAIYQMFQEKKSFGWILKKIDGTKGGL